MSYHLRPPILSVAIEDAMDIMILRNTARQAGSLIGFNPARRAQLSSAAAALGELVLKTGDVHTIHLNGVIDGIRLGLQISARTPWLADVPATNVLVALRSKVGDLVDEITISDDVEPVVRMFVWLNDLRSDS